MIFLGKDLHTRRHTHMYAEKAKIRRRKKFMSLLEIFQNNVWSFVWFCSSNNSSLLSNDTNYHGCVCYRYKKLGLKNQTVIKIIFVGNKILDFSLFSTMSWMRKFTIIQRYLNSLQIDVLIIFVYKPSINKIDKINRFSRF